MENQPQNNQEQEVDLVPVFVWISNGFKNIFTGVGNLLKGIGHFLILFLIFIQKNLIIIAITSIAGIALGWYLNLKSSDQFTAQIVVKPNFKSAGQLISNINYYQSLVEQEDFEKLSQELNTSRDKTSKITSLSIRPEFNDTELLEEYDQLARKSDTMALENFTFEGFKAAKRDQDYQFQLIEVSSKDRTVLENLIDDVIRVKENSIIKSEQQALKETADFDLKSMNYQLIELDSLIAAYQTAIKSSDVQGGNGTNLYLGDQKPSEALKNLFDQKRNILYTMSSVRKDKYSYGSTINVVSQYIKKGVIEKKHYRLKGAFIGLGFGLLIALFPLVWRFLKNYEKENA
ncbi:hypothetical protein JCM19297_2730 [Nonlabens ulvanivorans]|nr:hypothetical protein [Nonlabens ulvanivorans]GAK88217.1 hypothetical protein JCM19297_2730 [Nonlabens ulvanivorans]